MADISPVVRRNAEWADTFGGATTNLSQRHRYAQDQQRFAEQLVDQQEGEMMRRLEVDKGARDLFFKQAGLQRQMEKDQFDQQLQMEKFKADQELQPLKMEQAKIAAEAARALEIRRTNDELRAAKNAARLEADTDGFSGKIQEALDRGDLPGSKAFAEVATRAAIAHPFVPNTLRDDWFKQAKIERTADELMSEVAELPPEVRGRVSVTKGANGWSITASTVPPVKEKAEKTDSYSNIKRELEAAVELYGDKSKVPPAVWSSFEDRKKKLEGEFSPQPASAPAQPATDPRIALAQKALNDPAASEAHKAAARKLLGQ